MSYAVRNTIILLITLLVFGGAAFAYLKFVQQSEIEKLSEDLVSLNKDYQEKVQIRDQYQPLLDRYNKARDIILGYDKQLYRNNNPDDIYDYLSEINDDNLELYYDYNFQDSTIQDQYGIINSTIRGAGIYSDFVTFINKLENSALLNKVNNVSVTPAPNLGSDEFVSFSMLLSSYYQKINFEVNDSTSRFKIDPSVSIFNPFYPLILESLPPNEDNLVNIERSRILGLTSTRIFIVDQTGTTQVLKPGDKVYLGYLDKIDIKNNHATFNLDKGGIQEIFTLEVDK